MSLKKISAKKKKQTISVSRKSKASVLTEAKHIGNETVDWSAYSSYDEAKWVIYETMRHYNYFYDYKDAKKWILSYVKSNKSLHSSLKDAPDKMFTISLGALVKLIQNGAPIHEGWKKRVEDGLNNIAKHKPEVVNIQTSSISPAERLKEKTSDFIAEIEAVLDDHYNGIHFDIKEYNLYGELQKIDAAYNTAKAVVDYYKPILAEYQMLTKRKREDDLAEAYSHVSVQTAKKTVALLEHIIAEATRYMASKKAVRAVRKPRVKSAGQQTAKLQYAKDSAEFKLTSIDPQKIIGASFVALFNTKHRTLTLLESSSSSGFSVKGTSIQDVASATKKKLRKPDDVLPTITKATKASVLGVFGKINTKPSEGSSRCNNETIILKVWG